MSIDVPDRRLAAILAADVVGYSRQMAADETGTLTRLRALRTEVIDPLVAEHGGRLFKTMGDGFLVEFASVVQALRCAIAMQIRVAGDDTLTQMRIGLHQGDVVVDGQDLLGDGVNIAARLEGLAEPGGICISGRVREDAIGKMALDVTDLGTPALKNIDRPIQVFRVRLDAPAGAIPHPSTRPDLPSIAVLAFSNMSGDPEQEYFADGIAEEIITGLARVRWLFVIARNSSFTYKGRLIDVRTVGRELGVRYVLEGSIRKGGGKVRITGKLVEAATGTHVWADRFDGDLADVFALQDQVTDSIVRAIAPTLRHAEIERAKRKPPGSLDVYDLYLQALPHWYAMTREGSDQGLELLKRALVIAPDYALAQMVRGQMLLFRTAQGWTNPADLHVPEIIELAHRAVACDPNDPEVLASSAWLMGYAGGQYDRSVQLVERACQLGPNSAFVWCQSGAALLHADHALRALAALDNASQLDPLDPMAFLTQNVRAHAFVRLERYEEAVPPARLAVRLNPNLAVSWRVLAASLALCGQMEEAREAAHKLLTLEPDFTVAKLRRRIRSAALGRYDEQIVGLRMLGIPEQ